MVVTNIGLEQPFVYDRVCFCCKEVGDQQVSVVGSQFIPVIKSMTATKVIFISATKIISLTLNGNFIIFVEMRESIQLLFDRRQNQVTGRHYIL